MMGLAHNWVLTTRRRSRIVFTLTASALVGACVVSKPKVPYPAFVQVSEIEDVFLAELPGVRAKPFAGDLTSSRSGNRILVPAEWDFSTGAAPDKSVEIFVLAGEIELAGLTLRSGGYAWLPSGSSGTNLRTKIGAELLYFLDGADKRAAIQLPLVTGIDSGRWKPLSDDPEDFGLSELELRSDPGSGARTWLLKIDPVARQPWQSYSTVMEGYLISGTYRHSECVAGKSLTAAYSTGGYFLRPAGAVNGGGESMSTGTSIWFLRTLSRGERKIVNACE
jgi:hypothetical protein